ncbi:hypothetical protein ACR9PT_10090 [Piscirickettsia salmonis]|uniref:hypothetical protein n=1 Tax=Piscirickettsia salmonis TaxID=1238 RepID=UPI003EBF5B33
MLGDFASLDVQNTYRGSDAYVELRQGFGSFSPDQLHIYVQYQVHEPAVLESLFFSGLLDKKNKLPIIQKLNQLRKKMPQFLGCD